MAHPKPGRAADAASGRGRRLASVHTMWDSPYANLNQGRRENVGILAMHPFADWDTACVPTRTGSVSALI
jgi:hypothetical protein